MQLSGENLQHLNGLKLADLLRAAPSADTVRSILSAVMGLPQVELALSHAIMDCLAGEVPSPIRTELQDGAAKQSPMAQWLLAEIAQQDGDVSVAPEWWNSIIDAGGFGQLHEALLSQARMRNQSGDASGALATLRASLQAGNWEYAFLQRADRLYSRIISRLKTPPGRPLRIAVLGSTTTVFFLPSLRMAAVRDGFVPDIYESPYGAFRQEIMDATSDLYVFLPEFVIIATHWRDAHFAAFSDDAEARIDSVANEFKNLWATLQKRAPCTILQHNFDIPWDDPAGHLGRIEHTSRVACLRCLNERIVSIAPHGVAIVDIDSLASELGKRHWASARQWHMSKQHPASECLPALAGLDLSLIRAALGQSKKVLVLDLDNTLWGGVIGEDGLAGIRVGPPSAEGEAYAALQWYALELKERGILLAVCSKNNDADARLPFERHDGMILKLDDITAFFANWEDKPTNLRRMAKALNLGLDSFVFLDDNPAERALVRRELPQIAVPEINSADPSAYVAILHQGYWFESLAISGEDRTRSASYKANAAREELQTSSVDLDDFLKHLSMKVTRGAFNDDVFDRVTQLLGKTNQFNLTTHRHSREQIRRYAEDPNVWTQWFRLEDRFGDNGLIGVMIAVPIAPHEWDVDTFLMSCRVIGRKMEDYMMASLLDAARQKGIRRVIGRYRPTAKNSMVSGLYEKLGFSPEPDGQCETCVFELTEKPVVFPDYFQSAVVS